jgi:hypothetical protein
VNSDRNIPEDFDPIERRLREERPVPTADELDRIHHRAVAGARPEKRRRRLPAARLAMVSLVTGALMVGGSTASLAVSGLSGSGSAGTAQYLQFTPSSTPNTDTNDTQPTTDKGDNCPQASQVAHIACPTTTPTDTNDVEPDNSSGTNPTIQPVRQVSADTSAKSLPFTGLAVLPLLGAGVVLLAAGFLLRRRTVGTGRAA